MFEYLLVTVVMTTNLDQSNSVSTTRLKTIEECQFVAKTIQADLIEGAGPQRYNVKMNCIKVQKLKD